MKNKPAYAIESVDHALQLAQLLQQEGSLRVTDAAERLNVSRSTAHRLLAMLVYRDFAVRGDDRRYRPGETLRPTLISHGPISLLRQIGTPHLRELVGRVHETANLQVRAGTEIRFIASVECEQVLRVGDRTGRVLPVHQASGGLALLAALDDDALRRLYEDDPDHPDLAQLGKQLALIRKRGFAVNDQKTETGVVGISVVLAPHHDPLAAIALAVPSVRFNRARLEQLRSQLERAATALTRELAEHLPN
ncbi:IclR family transcriptional regulator C-terminal domain-containing protein [Streptomyces sp. W16]|uniref:IclR family transcriptional regulator n=1 Tax=Streptomyces sp. W16 TaxID=3076631 RepID=UPI00295BEF1B|nr:IclR family transcriptional regulator C-terminal domain-containing protein [Streptomyces sp. W16]MDV9169345.1 IclR family transcriptional regulator C-terminal domain-containing protein [Streptomyces sp. W16]